MNFERNGDSFKTIVGGFWSTLMKVFMIFYIATHAKRLLNNERDTNFTSFNPINMQNSVDYKEMKLSVFHVLRK